jgi:hypothetical protein
VASTMGWEEEHEKKGGIETDNNAMIRMLTMIPEQSTEISNSLPQ